MRWIKRTHLTTLRTLDKMETKISEYVHWFFNIFLVEVYEKIIINMLNWSVIALNILVYIPLFIIFIIPSISVELFLYSKKTPIPKVRNDERQFDLINKGK